jgi:CO/xanthine dehydrogenase FAD-binding subunit|tara:strand:- start:2284 stop:3120 length:837 start_codon:yes stop_codon:yes gene_type:complete
MSYITATTLEDALDALAAGSASVIAGGTDWFPAQGDRHFDGTLVDISRLTELRGVTKTDTGWRIGAATTWTDIIKADLPPAFNGLKLAAREVGSVQIQNNGTLAGNLCNASPAADGVPPLLTLDATVELSSTQGTRQMPLGAFLQGVRKTDRAAHEILTAVFVPDLPKGSTGSFVKLGARKYLVISICMVAVLVTVQGGLVSDIRIGVGAASPTAQRLTALEDSLRGLPVDGLIKAVTDEVILALSPISDVRASADYRQSAAPQVIRRAITLALEGVA